MSWATLLICVTVKTTAVPWHLRTQLSGLTCARAASASRADHGSSLAELSRWPRPATTKPHLRSTLSAMMPRHREAIYIIVLAVVSGALLFAQTKSAKHASGVQQKEF